MDADEAIGVIEAEGAGPARRWRNGPGDRYGRHDHRAHKVLFCVSGSIVFHLADRDVELAPGDRLDLPAGTPHAATVGPTGCECVEGYRRAGRQSS
jgi:quercetin dioxygenase-like cupin family protein